MDMKSPLAKAIVAFAGWLFFFQIVLPSILQMFMPTSTSSALCIEPAPPNQIKSIQLDPEAAARFFPLSLVGNLMPEIIRVQINPYKCGDSQPVLFVNCKTGLMEVNHDWVAKPRGAFTTPFSEDALQAVFDGFKAPHSPQQGPINVSEVYLTIKAAGAASLKDKTILGLDKLSHYTVTYVFPYKDSPPNLMGWIFAWLAGMRAYRTSKKKA
jgi:hypothetical protein